MAAIYSNGGNRWNILGFNFTKRDALSSVYKISMVRTPRSTAIILSIIILYLSDQESFSSPEPFSLGHSLKIRLWVRRLKPELRSDWLLR
jgi:hypothetical protein